MENILNNTFRQACRILDRLWIPYSRNVEVVIAPRMKQTYGRCVRQGDSYQIRISPMLLEADPKQKGLLNTMLHELLHTVPGCMNHGPLWNEYAQRVSAVTGTSIQRTTDPKNFGMENPVSLRTAKYVVVCQSCGNENYRMKRSHLVTHPEEYHCALCGGKLKSYILESDSQGE